MPGHQSALADNVVVILGVRTHHVASNVWWQPGITGGRLPPSPLSPPLHTPPLPPHATASESTQTVSTRPQLGGLEPQRTGDSRTEASGSQKQLPTLPHCSFADSGRPQTPLSDTGLMHYRPPPADRPLPPQLPRFRLPMPEIRPRPNRGVQLAGATHACRRIAGSQPLTLGSKNRR